MGWKVEGNLLDGVRFVIKEAWFGIREGQEDKRNYLHLRGEASEEGEVVDDEYHISLGLGDGWEVKKNGKSVAHVGGKDSFRKSTGIGRFITAMMQLDDDDLNAVLEERPHPEEAETWIGLTFDMGVEENKYTDRETKETRTYESTFPSAFVGLDGDDKKPAAKDKPAPRGRSRAKAAETEETEETEAKPRGRARRSRKVDNAELRAAVVAFASEFEDGDHDAFLEQVIDADEFPQADELQADDELMNDAMDPNGSIWQESR